MTFGTQDPWMMGLLIFSIVLLFAVILSEVSARSVLSASVLFLVAGFLAGDGMWNILHLNPNQSIVSRFIEFALFAVLFTDGQRVDIGYLKEKWRLPGRALIFGIPITILLIALCARYVMRLDWPAAFLVGAALSPTDPVFASAIIGRESIPMRVRHLLNIESGLNDGLALPVVLFLIALQGQQDPASLTILGELIGGIAIGVAIPWIAIQLERMPFLGASKQHYLQLVPTIALLVLATTSLTHANSFLAAFAAGITTSNLDPQLREFLSKTGESLADLFKFAALLIFGALIKLSFIFELGWEGILFVVLVLFAVRPIALGVSFYGCKLPRTEWLIAAWFGPRGFASAFFALLILHRGLPGSEHLFHLLAVMIAISMIAHSSTDVAVARWVQ